MSRCVLFALGTVCLLGVALGQEAGWIEDFDSPGNWYAIGYTRNPAKEYGFEIEDGAGHFFVRDGRGGMRWVTTPHGVNIRTYRNLEIRYRATGLQTKSAAYFLYMGVNPKKKLAAPPLRLNELVTDGEWHVMKKDIWTKDIGTRYATKLILACIPADKKADVWVDYIKLTAPEPKPLPPEPGPPNIGYRDDLDSVEAWKILDNVPYRGLAKTTGENGVGRFELEGMNRNAIWETLFDSPIDPGRFRYLVFKYQATGQRIVYTRNPRTLRYFMIVGDGKTTKRVYNWNSLIHDGAWHLRCVGLPSAKAFPNGIKFLRLRMSSEDSPGATFALDYLYFAAGPPAFNLPDMFSIGKRKGDITNAKLTFPDFERTPGARASELVRRYGGIGGLPEGDVTIDGIPFRIKDAAYVFGVRTASALSIDAPKSMRAAYFLINTRIEGKNDFCSWGGPIRFVEQPERFSVVLRYDDGSTFESVPYNIQGKSFMMPPGIGLFGVINPHPDKAVESLSLHDKTATCGFHLIAATIQQDGQPLFDIPPCPRRLPPVSREIEKTPDDSTTASVTQSAVTLKSGWLTVSLDLAKGIRPSRILSDLLGQDMEPSGELFSLDTKGGAISNNDLRVVAVERRGDDGAAISLRSEKAQAITGSLGLTWNTPREIGMRVSIKNASDKPLRGRLTVTPMAGLRIDADPDNVWLFYPGPGTIITNEPFFFEGLQSEHFPLQVMAAWSPPKGGGFYFMTRDSTCERDKRFFMEKFDGGVSMGCRFMYLDLAPGEETTTPEFAIGAFAGDWRDALNVYRGWVKTWHKPIASHPEWFRRLYSFVGISRTMEVNLDAKGKRINFTPHIEECKRAFGSVDYLHIYSFGISKKYGHYGDYCHYESFGGRECICNEIQRLYKSGLPVGVYLDPLLADDRSLLATKRNGKAWMVLNEKGEKTSWSKSNFYLCAAIPAMRQHWHDTYERLAKEIGPRGMYMDQVGYWNPASWACYNAAHGHKIPSGVRPPQCRLVKAIREGINRVDPTIANYSEFVPIDVACQYQDGSFTHTIRYEWELPQCFLINPVYLAFPEMKCFEIYAGSGNTVGENSRLPVQLVWARESLNLGGDPTGMFGTTKKNIRTLGRIWHAYADAFATREPRYLVSTLRPEILANHFPSVKYDVYALFNDRPYTVDGRVIAVPHEAGNEYWEAWEERKLEPEVKNGRAAISVSVPPKMARFVVVRKAGAPGRP